LVDNSLPSYIDWLPSPQQQHHCCPGTRDLMRVPHFSARRLGMLYVEYGIHRYHDQRGSTSYQAGSVVLAGASDSLYDCSSSRNSVRCRMIRNRESLAAAWWMAYSCSVRRIGRPTSMRERSWPKARCESMPC